MTTPDLFSFFESTNERRHPVEPGVLPTHAAMTTAGVSSVDLLADLNPPQREAVLHTGSAVLVVAGAGSGKTRVLTRRIAHLVGERGVHPGSILAITFTNKAAAEMKARVVDLVGNRAKPMWVSTFPGDPRSESGPEEVPATGDHELDLEPEERAHHSRSGSRECQ